MSKKKRIEEVNHYGCARKSRKKRRHWESRGGPGARKQYRVTIVRYASEDEA